MDQKRWERVQQIFGGAIGLAGEERESFLAEQCRDDAELREQVESLLRYDTHSDEIAGAILDGSPEMSDLSGSEIGPYRLTEKLGEGGFGTVYRAEQSQPLKREVAIKIVRWDRDSRQVLERFEAERQALAKMEHPGIARVFDAGETEQGRPYFVMELVHGTPITKFCDANNLSIQKRLDLFAAVCDAVQHAHQKGIIHRDLKPSNILVSDGDDPQPKVIDFGISKAAAAPVDAATMLTQVGQLVGTPSYMSPEQASGGDVDTRSDVYALGVLLYELLTGATPFDPSQLKGAAWGEVERLIREVEPPKPSSRVETASAAIASRRDTQPITLSKGIRGDLDWIVMRALEKERARRYSGADAFAEDVRRHLNNEPVLASPPSQSYRFQKFVRRNRQSVLAVSVALVALIVGLVAATFGFMEASRERDRARSETEKVRQVSSFLVELFAVSDPSEARGNSVTARELLDDAVISMRSSLEDQPEVRSELLHTMGNVYLQLGLLEDARPLLESAYDERLDRLGVEREETQRSMLAISRARSLQGEQNEAEAIALEAEEVAQRLYGANDPRALRATEEVAKVLMAQSRDNEAEARFREVLRVRSENLGDDDPSTLHALSNLGLCLSQQSETDEASELQADVLERRRRTLGEDHPETLTSVYQLATTLRAMSLFDEAEALLREAVEAQLKILGPDHHRTLEAQYELANLMRTRAKYEESERLHFYVYEKRSEILGKEHPHTLNSLDGIGNLYWVMDEFAKAEPYYVKALEIKRRLYGEQHRSTETTMQNYAVLLGSSGRTEEAIEQFRQLLVISTERYGAENPDTLRIKSNLAAMLRRLPDKTEAEQLYNEVLASRRKVLGTDHQETMSSAIGLAHLYNGTERPAEAVKLFEEVIEVRRRVLGPEHPHMLITLLSYAWSLRQIERFDDCRETLDELIALTEKLYGENDRRMLPALEQLSHLAKDIGDEPLLESTMSRHKAISALLEDG